MSTAKITPLDATLSFKTHDSTFCTTTPLLPKHLLREPRLGQILLENLPVETFPVETLQGSCQGQAIQMISL